MKLYVRCCKRTKYEFYNPFVRSKSLNRQLILDKSNAPRNSVNKKWGSIIEVYHKAHWHPSSTIKWILLKSISETDDRIKADLVNFFPGGLKQISKLTDDEINSIIKDPEMEYSCVQERVQLQP